jgi:hypothetical protein
MQCQKYQETSKCVVYICGRMYAEGPGCCTLTIDSCRSFEKSFITGVAMGVLHVEMRPRLITGVCCRGDE